MDSQENESSDSDLTLIPVDEWIKQATDPILRRVEELCALLASRIELKSTGNSGASGSRRDNTSASPRVASTTCTLQYHIKYAFLSLYEIIGRSLDLAWLNKVQILCFRIE